MCAVDSKSGGYGLSPYAGLGGWVDAVESVSGSVPIVASFDDGTLHIDFDKREVTLDGKPLDLNPKEFAVLTAIAVHRDQVVSADKLIVAADITGPFAPPVPPEIEAVLGVQSKLALAGAFLEGDIVQLDIEEHEVTWRGNPLPFDLEPNEFDVLVELAGQETREVPIEAVFEAAEATNLSWPYSTDTSPEKVLERIVDHLRVKLLFVGEWPPPCSVETRPDGYLYWSR